MDDVDGMNTSVKHYTKKKGRLKAAFHRVA
jgi:hypothetical protein